MKHLSIDIETFSSVDIKKCGAFKYAEAPDFQILLLAYAYDDEPVQIVDFMAGERLPDEVFHDLTNPYVIKQAYNASFEWYCLSVALGFVQHHQHMIQWLPQWHCTMLHGLYCGYTAGLAATGDALGLPSDKKKLNTGKALIRTFCVPTKPSKANGQRTRTMPHHEPERWQLFKEYCMQDVVTEREIERKLSAFPVPDDIQAQWVQDQIINLRGVAADLEMVYGAIACNEKITRQLTEEATDITGLNNPNSVTQLTGWLEKETGQEFDNLRKDTVSEVLQNGLENGNATRMLELRQELSKTSIKKYQAMVDTTGNKGRIRGLLQFYGANRTGRWAGRLVQVQNLPKTHLEALPLARKLIMQQDTDILQMIFGSIPNALSQLVRTALIAPDGKLLISADFSAIEARVIAWLAGEQWRLNVFATHGKIYEASASQMFGVPVEKISKGNPEYELRQKGKIAELALGYQGATGALKQMGALQMGLKEEELQDIVDRWRESNRRIVDLWYSMGNAAIETVKTGRSTATHGILFAREGDVNGLDFLTMTLPSGRKLFYANPRMGVNKWGGDAISYADMDQTTKKWAVTDTYGGKLAENSVQAIARDCLAEAITKVEAACYPVVFHVHDEIIAEVPEETAEQSLEHICNIMAEPLSWAPGLQLKADGYVSKFYKKD